MAYEGRVGTALDYAPCQYGTSKLVFRGPQSVLQGDYVAFLGSTETYGKFVAKPFPALTGDALGVTPLNLGCVNAGIDTFLEDATVMSLCRGARAVVVQAMAAHRLSNPLYSVHPRRNDRFLRATRLLLSLYPEAEFTDVHFTRHLLSILNGIDPERFGAVVDELRTIWVKRMRELARRVDVPMTLLWVSGRRPEESQESPYDQDPQFVTREMIDEISDCLTGVVEIALPQTAGLPPDGMVFGELDMPVALELPGPEDHQEIARGLAPILKPTL